ncbi:MAG: hypothetical protein AVDCRST_MAG90-2931, partial [uncultured Microvirga sp.]
MVLVNITLAPSPEKFRTRQSIVELRLLKAITPPK